MSKQQENDDEVIDEPNETLNKPTNQHWRKRLVISIIMVVLSFIGVILVYIDPLTAHISWYYWLSMAPIFMILSLWLRFQLKKTNENVTAKTIWHEVFHWIGLIVAIYILHVYVRTGIVGKFEAGLLLIDILALAVFLLGVHLEPTFILVGLILGLCALLMAVLTKYIIPAIIVIAVIGSIFIYVMLRKGGPKRKKSTGKSFFDRFK